MVAGLAPVIAAAMVMSATGALTGEAAAAMTLRPVDYADIRGWPDDDHGVALATFRRGCEALAAGDPSSATASIASACHVATGLGKRASSETARRFFETWFAPHRVVDAGRDAGLFTGYFEPELAASRVPSPGYAVPILGPPEGLVSLAGMSDRGDLPESFSHGLAGEGRIAELPARADIEAGSLAGSAQPIAWLADPVDAYFLHVQGSGRLRYQDGTSDRATYAGKNGHPYTSIGRLLVERGEMSEGEVTMQTLRAWLMADRARGAALMAENRSYIFFRKVADDDPRSGPAGQLGVALTAGRSLAVDRRHHAANLPVWVETTLPGERGGPDRPFRRLMIAQDTGSAIRGPIRGDIFFGSGTEAGEIAGRMQALGHMVVLLPRCPERSC